jgi:hypothetical protein
MPRSLAGWEARLYNDGSGEAFNPGNSERIGAMNENIQHSTPNAEVLAFDVRC